VYGVQNICGFAAGLTLEIIIRAATAEAYRNKTLANAASAKVRVHWVTGGLVFEGLGIVLSMTIMRTGSLGHR
jgi:hypothetical protein